MSNLYFRNAIRDYLNQIPGVRAPPVTIPEESAPDISTAAYSSAAFPLEEIDLPVEPHEPYRFRFFIDGVQRTVPIYIAQIDGIPVPIFITHLVAGAMQRVNDSLIPFIRRELLVLLLPLSATRARDQLFPVPQGIRLDNSGNYYNILNMISRHDILYTDISESLRDPLARTWPKEEYPVTPDELYASGKVRRAAKTRATVLLRVLELAVLWDILRNSQLNKNDLIALDGPLFLPFRYSRLLDQQLSVLSDFNNASQGNSNLFELFFRHTIGVVKNVEVVPDTGLGRVFNAPYRAIVFKFNNVVPSAKDQISDTLISVFVRLRPEVTEGLSPLWSEFSGLIRLDIGYPAIADNTAQWLSSPGLNNFYLEIRRGTHVYNRLSNIVGSFYNLRWPLPATNDPHRLLTEIYPIYEAERWLSSTLMNINELQALL